MNGIEPPQTDLESIVLPLYYILINNIYTKNYFFFNLNKKFFNKKCLTINSLS